MDELERRLVAVLNADMVGFTRLMAADDLATIRAVARLREQVEALVRAHRGHVIDFVGDNFLAEFQSALGATRCASRCSARSRSATRRSSGTSAWRSASASTWAM